MTARLHSIVRKVPLLGGLSLALLLAACGGGGGLSAGAGSGSGTGSGSSSSVSAIAVTAGNYTDYWGYTIQMQAATTDAVGASVSGAAITWVSSDPAVASVDSAGLVTLKTRGSAAITGQVGSVASPPVTVTSEGFSTLLATSAQDNCSTNEARTQILCWGDGYPITPNRPLQLQFPKPTPILMGSIPAGTKIKQVAPSFPFSCALTDAGQAYCWRGGMSDSEIPALGTLVSTNPQLPQLVAQGERPAGVTFKKIAVNRTTSACGIGTDNEVYCWGKSDAVRQLANPPASKPLIYSAPVKMARGVLAASDVIADIVLSINMNCGITQAGRPFCWLPASQDREPRWITTTAIPANVKLVSIASDQSDYHMGLGDDGWAYTWGSGPGYRAGDGSTATISDAIPVVRRVAQGDIPVSETLTRVAVGGNAGANCVLSTTSAVYCWGAGFEGALGNGNLASNQNVGVPKLILRGAIPANVTLSELTCGTYHCVALGSNRRMYSWGYNEGAALGVTIAGNGQPVEISRIDKF
jgi:Regulator of chromosome condensation (RCC1) repeat/Bacterial Ig-like domain (group 2)